MSRLAALAAALATTAAAPIALTPPVSPDYSTLAPVGPCGDLAHPCQSNLGQATLGWSPPTGPGFTYGGSLTAGVGGVSHGRGPASLVAGSFWVRSPDGQWTLQVGVAHTTYPGWRP